jgi:radical SAM protein with 4Fe4S-binding SPASM domain
MGSKCWLAGSYISYNDEQGRRMRDRLQELNPYLDEFYPLPLYDQGGLVAIDEDKIKWTGNPGHLSAPVAPMPCWVLFSQAHVQYDGKVSACCFDHGNDFEMGDLKEKSFAEIWRGEKFQALRQAHLNNDVRGTACEKCIYG